MHQRGRMMVFVHRPNQQPAVCGSIGIAVASEHFSEPFLSWAVVLLFG